jgi:hypothetical protein
LLLCEEYTGRGPDHAPFLQLYNTTPEATVPKSAQTRKRRFFAFGTAELAAIYRFFSY